MKNCFGGDDALIITSSNSIARIDSTNFSNNWAHGRGSVLFADSFESTIEVTSSTFVNNTSLKGGIGYVHYDS